MLARKPFTVFYFFCCLLFSSAGLAELTLEPGSYVNRTHLDNLRGRANLNFTYRGCDPNPSASRVRLRASQECREAESYDFRTSQDETAISGKVGEIITSYDEPVASCPENQMVTRRLHVNQSFIDLYNEFQARGCFPSHIVLTNTNSQNTQRIRNSLRNRTLCNLPMTRIQRPGFPTDENQRFHMHANDNGFRIGDHTNYRFDHNLQIWCVKYRDQEEQCGQWAAPLPLAYRDDGDRRFHVRATVTLGPGGQASLRAFNGSYPSEAALFNAQRNGEFTRTDRSQGRIDYNTWRNRNGLVRSLVRTYETDTPGANHERSLNFFARNVFGTGVTKSWCPTEHCFVEPPQSPSLSELACSTEQNQASQNQGCYRSCGQTPSINMRNGGSLNACFSCIGITPGLCALRSTVGDNALGGIPIVRANFNENPNFSIDPVTGEYRLQNNVAAGLTSVYSQIIEGPANPGCHQGSAPAYPEVFAPDTEPERSVQSKDKKPL